jgi:hypothetical protein
LEGKDYTAALIEESYEFYLEGDEMGRAVI